MPETVEEISEKPEVREELARTAGKKPREKVKARARDKFWFVTHALLLVGCAIIYFLLGSKLIPLPQANADLARRILRGAALIVVLLAIAKTISVYGLGKIEDASTRFTLRRVQRLVVGLLIALIAISVIFVNWYAALTALGVGSVIIGLAVQAPMKSFIGWIYILVRRPYRVGDRIKIGDATGDVIDVSYLDTTLWEFGGQYLSTAIRAAASSSSLMKKCSTSSFTTIRGRFFLTFGTRSNLILLTKAISNSSPRPCKKSPRQNWARK